MKMFRKASLSVAGLALAVGGLTTVTAVEANAAGSCAGENQAAGAARNEAGHRYINTKRAKKKLKKAKRAYHKDHSKANKKKVKKARRTWKRARARQAVARSRAASTAAAARRCNAATSPAPAATPRQVQDQFTRALGSGAAALADVVKQASAPLASSGLPLEELTPVINALADAIESGAADPEDLPAIAQDFGSALQNGLDPSAVTGLLGQGDLGPAQLASLLEQLGSAASDNDIPISGVLDSLNKAVADTASMSVPTTPDGVVTYLLDRIEQGAVGTPFEEPTAAAVGQVRGLLTQIIGGLLGGLPIG